MKLSLKEPGWWAGHYFLYVAVGICIGGVLNGYNYMMMYFAGLAMFLIVWIIVLERASARERKIRELVRAVSSHEEYHRGWNEAVAHLEAKVEAQSGADDSEPLQAVSEHLNFWRRVDEGDRVEVPPIEGA